MVYVHTSALSYIIVTQCRTRFTVILLFQMENISKYRCILTMQTKFKSERLSISLEFWVQKTQPKFDQQFHKLSLLLLRFIFLKSDKLVCLIPYMYELYSIENGFWNFSFIKTSKSDQAPFRRTKPSAILGYYVCLFMWLNV